MRSFQQDISELPAIFTIYLERKLVHKFRF